MRFLGAKYVKNVFVAGLWPGPRWGAYSAPPDPLAGFKTSNFKGREGKGNEGD